PQHREVVIAAVMLVLPVNFLFALLENYIFLLFPTREMAVSPGDLQGTGRRMVVLVVKMLGVTIAGSIAGIAAALSYAGTGDSLLLACAVAAIVLMLIGIAMMPLLCRAFVRFDPSVDTPV
ncbi:MAG: hypothetical protein JO353_04270, partial [Phycisphaerae bacterium]|nr:hypothetical protein [Phycisphaerae bacterium]